ncbi:hypothetical protein M501DRAFT_984488 [Patellaria atrata CBS 101060]|uniref:DUF7704 domain-containing protein n=1 Tax=Patellaria atrata CBS 101060 TaxID=1346257 RepID=A0A9P4VIN9_9PEZI|nr:hypothetical protein M501DRAFT_984488 [Patellaria atrata CBS 101060]
MSNRLPLIPWFVFTILEPFSTTCAFLGPLLYPKDFVSMQLPHEVPHELLPSERILALQLGNCYLLLSFIGLFVLNTTTELRVIHAFLMALALGDIGHLAVTASVMGPHPFVDVYKWSLITWGNIGFTLFLLLMRASYFAGVWDISRKMEHKEVKAQ